MTDHTELKRLAEAAPEGPWFGPEYAPGTSYVFDVDLGSLLHYESIDTEQDACLRYVAAANPAAVLALIAEIKRLAELLECAQGDFRQAMQIIEKLTPEADLYQQIQIAAGSLPSSWEIALRVENGYGGVDLIDPHGTVVDLDDVDSTLGESVAGAVAFAIAKEASHV